ncbi:hypothetical protein JD844_020110 [Phrynosoma platyrhinos]|uniref:Cytosolic Fe-S cluster assembly factor NUBP1 n=1 Tax=Phrynosoma platyrhinos TaxID=52577 RepID=A0ABQ7TR53_PHRPL|nr:hypothetical protein JD844_020110 [Phrynosoma platyrhinos]
MAAERGGGSALVDVPPQECPGTGSDQAGKAEACRGCPNQGVCASGRLEGPDPAIEEIKEKMKTVKHKLLVLSGKGGVGKSTFTLLDIDICGPSIPKIMGLEGEQVHQSGSGWSPVYIEENLGVMSVGFLLSSPDDAVIWRGPKKNGMIKQFLRDVDWGEIDYLIIDTPPGTSDEHLSIVQYLSAAGIDGAVIITTPQKESQIFPPTTGGAEAMCHSYNLPLLGKVPLDPQIGKSCDKGQSFFSVVPNSPATLAYQNIIQRENIRRTSYRNRLRARVQKRPANVNESCEEKTNFAPSFALPCWSQTGTGREKTQKKGLQELRNWYLHRPEVEGEEEEDEDEAGDETLAEPVAKQIGYDGADAEEKVEKRGQRVPRRERPKTRSAAGQLLFVPKVKGDIFSVIRQSLEETKTPVPLLP